MLRRNKSLFIAFRFAEVISRSIAPAILISPRTITRGRVGGATNRFIKFEALPGERLFRNGSRRNEAFQNAVPSDGEMKLMKIFDFLTRLSSVEFNSLRRTRPRITISCSSFYFSRLVLSFLLTN